jgi:hypothetical protein
VLKMQAEGMEKLRLRNIERVLTKRTELEEQEEEAAELPKGSAGLEAETSMMQTLLDQSMQKVRACVRAWVRGWVECWVGGVLWLKTPDSQSSHCVLWLKSGGGLIGLA